MSNQQRSITAASDQAMCDLIARAASRLVVLAPAVSTTVASAIREKWRQLGGNGVNVILDLDPEVFRLGYGDFDGLKILESTAAELGTIIQRQPGIRIGLIVSDTTTMVYAPTPALIEAGPSSPDTPNAVVFGGTPPEIERDLGHGEHGVKGQVIGLDKATATDVERVEIDLRKNPVQKFDIARTVRVFNANFEFVEFEMTGTHIGRHDDPDSRRTHGADKGRRDEAAAQGQFPAS